MAKLSPKVWIDNFEVKDSIITAFTLVDDVEIDFSINKSDFEEFCDRNEMREWSDMTFEWYEVYDGQAQMYKFLKAYIENLYDMEAMDIEAPIKSIVQSQKVAI